MRNILFALTSTAASFSTLHAANIVLVTENVAGSASFISFLEDGGNNTVTTGEYNNIHLSSTLLNDLNSADLVVIGRLTTSGTYTGSAEERTAWAGVTANLWLASPFLSESDKWAWSTDADSTGSYSGAVTAQNSTAAAHPIYSGVSSLATGFAGSPAYNLVASGENLSVMGGNDTLVAGGTTIGVRNSSGNEHVIIAEFAAGAVTGDGDTFGAPRLFFAAPSDFADVHADALPMYANARDYILAVPEPSSSLLLCASALGLAIRRRR